MSPDEPNYLPADAAKPEPPHEANIQPTPSMYDAWDRGDELQERVDERRLLAAALPSNSLFGFLEVIYPFRPRFPASLGWAMVYFLAGLLVVIFFFIFAQLIPGLVAAVAAIVWYMLQAGNNALPTTPDELTKLILAPMLIAGHIAAISLALILLRILLGPSWTRRLAFRLPGAWHFLLVALLVPAVVVLATGVYGLALELGVPSLGMMEQVLKLVETWPWWFAVLVIGVGPAFGEELWCRGVIGLGLFGRNGVVARILISSFYFGFLHGDPAQGTMAAVMGLVLAYVLLTTRCFWMPMLIHFLNNSIDVIAGRFESLKALDREPEQIPLVLYAGAFILFLTITVSLFRTRARLVNAYGSGSLFWEPVYAGLEHPPANSGVAVKRPHPDLIDVGLVAMGIGAFTAAVTWAIMYG